MRRTMILTVALTLVHAGAGFAPAQDAQVPDLQSPSPLGTPTSFELPNRWDDRGWFSAEYMLDWTKASPVPVPLVTQGNPADIHPGALGQPGTRILYGKSNVDLGVFSGARFDTGFWFDNEQTIGMDAGAFFLGNRDNIYSVSSVPRGAPLLATPFFDAVNHVPAALLTTAPGIAAGLTAVHNSSQPWGFDVNFLGSAVRNGNLQADLLLGYRNFQLGESIDAFRVFSPLDTFAVTGLSVGGIPAAKGDTLSTYDHFGTRNQFNGAQLGGRCDWEFGRCFASATAKLGLGDCHQIVDIDGGSLIINAKQTQTSFPGGILTGPSNMGSFSRDIFAVVPEVTFNVGIYCTSWMRTYVGYNFLYISDVARPGNQIDPAVNINRVPTDPAFGTPGGPPGPTFSFRGSDYWAQGVNFGLEFRY